MRTKKHKTFTLIEMLIVIVIIGILAAALIPRLQSIQGRARDAKRKTDLSAIYNAQEVHKIDNGTYANVGIHLWSFNSPATTWLTGLAGTYMTTVPVDPINNYDHDTTGGYSYRYWNWEGQNGITSYSLNTVLENPKDSSRCELKNYVFAHSTNPTNGVALCPDASYPTRRYQYVYDPINIKKH